VISKAIGRYLRISPQKSRLVIDQIRGKEVNEALSFLKYSRKRSSYYIEKILRSAIANAEQKEEHLDIDTLYISKAFIDQGPSYKRIRPRAMGRAFRILHRMSHITIELEKKQKKETTS
jgi:large subunit ribosomal protein L22